jgi:DNA-binding NtrC family response regulator
MNNLMLHDWPGNVRELENTIERAVIFAEQPIVGVEDIHFSRPEEKHQDGSFRELRLRAVNQFEETYLKNLLFLANGNISKAAQTAKIARRTLRELLEKHSIQFT